MLPETQEAGFSDPSMFGLPRIRSHGMTQSDQIWRQNRQGLSGMFTRVIPPHSDRKDEVPASQKFREPCALDPFDLERSNLAC